MGALAPAPSLDLAFARYPAWLTCLTTTIPRPNCIGPINDNPSIWRIDRYDPDLTHHTLCTLGSYAQDSSRCRKCAASPVFEKAKTRATKSLLSTPPACVMPAFQPAPAGDDSPQRHQPHASESAMVSIQRAESERAGGGRGCRAERAHGRTTCDAPARLRAKGGLLGWWQ